jgi:hypothetical protein
MYPFHFTYPSFVVSEGTLPTKQFRIITSLIEPANLLTLINFNMMGKIIKNYEKNKNKDKCVITLSRVYSASSPAAPAYGHMVIEAQRPQRNIAMLSEGPVHCPMQAATPRHPHRQEHDPADAGPANQRPRKSSEFSVCLHSLNPSSTYILDILVLCSTIFRLHVCVYLIVRNELYIALHTEIDTRTSLHLGRLSIAAFKALEYHVLYDYIHKITIFIKKMYMRIHIRVYRVPTFF